MAAHRLQAGYQTLQTLAYQYTGQTVSLTAVQADAPTTKQLAHAYMRMGLPPKEIAGLLQISQRAVYQHLADEPKPWLMPLLEVSNTLQIPARPPGTAILDSFVKNKHYGGRKV